MSDTIDADWLALAGPAAPKVLWSKDGWAVTAAGMAEINGANGIDRYNLADLRDDGLLSVPIYSAADPGVDLAAFLPAFRAALRLHRLHVDPTVLRASEATALEVGAQSRRDAEWSNARRLLRRRADAEVRTDFSLIRA